jgi:hypothetical protein
MSAGPEGALTTRSATCGGSTSLQRARGSAPGPGPSLPGRRAGARHGRQARVRRRSSGWGHFSSAPNPRQRPGGCRCGSKNAMRAESTQERGVSEGGEG